MMNPMRTVALLFCQLIWFVPNGQAQLPEGETIAHLWNEEVLEGIRNDFARPTVHARNLLHTSIAMFDIWAAYEEGPTETFLLGKTWAGFTCPFEGVDIPDSEEALLAAREEAISYAVYRIMTHRFGDTPDGEITMFNINTQMAMLGYDIGVTTTDYQNDGPAALGNYVAEQVIAFGMQDGANEAEGYAADCYQPINPNIQPEMPGNPDVIVPTAGSRLSSRFIDQSGNPSTDIPEFVGLNGGKLCRSLWILLTWNFWTATVARFTYGKPGAPVRGFNQRCERYGRPLEMEFCHGFRMVLPPRSHGWRYVGHFAGQHGQRRQLCHRCG